MRAAQALGLLMQLQTRLDPLCTELLNGLQASETDAGVREALAVALRDVIKQAGAHITPPMLDRVVSVLQQDLGAMGDEGLSAKTQALAAASTFLDATQFDALLSVLMAVRSVQPRAHGRHTFRLSCLTFPLFNLHSLAQWLATRACIAPPHCAPCSRLPRHACWAVLPRRSSLSRCAHWPRMRAPRYAWSRRARPASWCCTTPPAAPRTWSISHVPCGMSHPTCGGMRSAC